MSISTFIRLVKSWFARIERPSLSAYDTAYLGDAGPLPVLTKDPNDQWSHRIGLPLRILVYEDWNKEPTSLDVVIVRYNHKLGTLFVYECGSPVTGESIKKLNSRNCILLDYL